MKRAVAVIMMLAVVFSAVGCGNKKEDIGINRSSVSGEDAGNYYYAVEDLTEKHGGSIMVRIDSETIALIDNMSEEITIIKGDEVTKVKTGISEEIQRFGLSDNKEFLINTFGNNENLVYKIDLNGNLIEKIPCSELLSPEYEGKKYKMENSLLSLVGNKLIFQGKNGYQSFDISSSETSAIVDGYLDGLIIEEGKAIGVLFDKTPLVVDIDLTTKETTIIKELAEDGFYQSFTLTRDGFLGIDFEGNLNWIAKDTEEIKRESLKEMGDIRFLRKIRYSGVETIGDDLYLSVSVMKDRNNPQDVTNSILKLTRKEGVNPSKTNQKKIVIYGKNRDYLLEAVAQDYMTYSNDLLVEIKTFDDISLDDYIKLVNTNVLSGEQVDMIYFDELPVTKLIGKGFFEPLDGHISDLEISNIDQNILQSLKYDGRIYGIPRAVTFYSLYASDVISKESIEDYSNSNYSFEGYKNLVDSIAKTGAKSLRNLDKSILFDTYLGNNIQSIIDVKNKSFDIKKFNQLIDLVDLSSDEKNMDKNLDRDNFLYYGTKDNIGFEPIKDADVEKYQYYKNMYGSDYRLLPLPSFDGGYSLNVNPIGVLASSNMKEEAINLLKFITLDEKNMKSIMEYYLLPLNSKLIKERMDNNLYEGDDAMMYTETTKYGEKVIEIKVPYNNEYAMIIDQYNNVKGSSAFYKDILTLLSKEAKNYYESGNDREQFVSNVQNKINLYLNE